MEKDLTYIHFSDLHIGDKIAKPFLSHIKAELLKDVKYVSSELGRIDVIFMTGDLVQSGDAAEYVAFEGFMNSVMEILKSIGSNPYVFFVPGNHDLERLADYSSPIHQVFKNWNSNQELRNNFFWTTPAYTDYCKDRFLNYSNFVQRYSNIPKENTMFGIMPGDYFSSIEVNGLKIGVLGLNSSFLQIEAGDFTGKLGIYLKQVESIFGDRYVEVLSKNDINFLLTHHNSEWFEPESRDEYKGEIYLKEYMLEHFCGHNHIPQTEYINLNYTGENRINIGPSLCGLEFYGDKFERVHGYHAGRYIVNDDNSVTKQVYHRLAIQRNSSYYFDRDINFQCEKGNEYSERILGKLHNDCGEREHSANEINDILAEDKPKSGCIQLHPSTLHSDQAYSKVRIQEQKEARQTLESYRYLWIKSSFGLGDEQFLACVLRSLQVDFKGVFKLNCEDVDSYIGLDKLVREHFSVSINNLVDELTLACESPILIFNGVTKTLVDRELASLSTMASSITRYNEKIRLIFVSTEVPSDGYFDCVQLHPLSKSEVKHFIESAMPNKKFNSFEVDKILDITNGYPICLDIIVKQLEYAGLDDLNEADFSFSQGELKIPLTIKDYILSLRTSSLASERNCYSLLILLSLLPKGDTYSSIKRYQSTSPYKTGEVDILKNRNLITIDHYYIIKNHSLISSIDVLRIPKIYRDFILSLESKETLRQKNSTICEMYLGKNWINGQIKLKNVSGDVYYPFTYYNAEAAMCFLLHNSCDTGDSEYFNRYLVAAGNYIYELEKQHMYYVALYVGDSFYQLVKDHVPDGAERSFSFLKFELADMMRMNSYYDESEELFLSVLDENLLTRENMQTSRECLGLLYSKRGDKEKAVHFADEMLKYEKNKKESSNVLLAKYIKALNVESATIKLKEMKAIYRKTCKDMNLASISANSARVIAALDPSEETLKMIDRELKKFKVSYIWMQLVQCKYNMYTNTSLSKTLDEKDIEFVRKVYSYSFAQMMLPMLNDSHRILWDYYIKVKEYPLLVNMLRHSIYVWELNNADAKINLYVDKMKNNKEFMEWMRNNVQYNEDALSIERNWSVLQ